MKVWEMKKSNLIFIFATILALLMGFKVQNLLSQVKQAGVVQAAAVKDNVTIGAYQLIQASDVTLKEVPKTSVQPDTLFSLQEVIGKRMAMTVLPSTTLRKGNLVSSSSLTGVLSSLGKENVVAVTIPIDIEQAGLGKVGEFVTLHGIMRQGTEAALVSIRKVPILEKTAQVVTVAVTTEQSDALDQVLLSGGKIRIVLNQP
ncbi:SAF domain-containing protein [Paenibacillus alginolyticus]|uniref:SAF domain-containing protein n=1 Tax=Paenibacillus alginolyticus TaxID=59839 RepID=UPI00041CFF74|nr:SAF domain-containing protein [Paenibacillus alginolyticus]MCY9668729.1 SAF domain-containing protein [Paenibacillus alginolyticus]